MGHIGHIEAFDETTSDWRSYEERLKAYLLVNDVPIAKKVPAFLSLIGAKTYALLKSLTAPDAPSSCEFDDLLKLLGDHLAPQPSVIGERAKFYKRSQRSGESIAEFVAELRSLVQSCEFGSFLDEALRDCFVCGLLREDIQRVLFTEDKKLTFQKAVDRALAMETATKNAAFTHNSVPMASEVNKVRSEKQSGMSRSCFRCGSPNHSSEACPHIGDTCYNCNHKGHIQRACRKGKKARETKPRKRVKMLTSVQNESSVPLQSVNVDPFTVPMNVDGVLLTMELDTGAAVSVISWREFKKLFPHKQLQPASLKLRTYTGAMVKPKGLAKVVVHHNDQTAELPLYVVDTIGPALLGREWMQDMRLDWKNIGFLKHLGPSREMSKHWQQKLEALLDSHSELFKDELGTIAEEQAVLVLREGSQPKFVKARSVPFALQGAVEAELVKMEKLGIITPVATSDYATPLVPVVKRDGSLRLCGDYKTTVNPCLEVDRYPLPRIDDLLAALAGGEEFSKIDLSRAYQQVVMAESSRKLLTLNTHKGLYTMNRLAFGISSAPSIFQRIMDNMLKGLEGVSCYLDDILVTGKTKQEHFRNLEAVLSRLQERGVRIRRDKCSFFQRELRYLGYVINAEGVCASPEKVSALLNAPAPRDKQQLQSFLGMVNYYGKFVQRLSTLAHPLYRLLKQTTEWAWDESCQLAFKEIKAAMASPPVLAHYDPKRPLQLACDASQYGIGAVLSQKMTNGSVLPVAYASRTLSSAEKNYSQIEKEALALVFGVKKFHFYVYGRFFTLVTDHKPLQAIFGPKTGIPAMAAARMQRWAVTLSAYNYALEFKKSSDNAEADCLSRLPLDSSETESAEESETFYLLRFECCPSQAKTSLVKLGMTRY